MKIDSYNVNLQGSTLQKSYHSVKEDLQIWFTEQQAPAPVAVAVAVADPKSFSNTLEPLSKTDATNQDDLFQLSDTDKLKIQLIEEFIKLMTGKDFKFKIPKGAKKPSGYDNKGHAVTVAGNGNPQGQTPNFGLIYNRHEEKAVRTKVDFNASGVVRTADGREITFSATFHVDQTLVESSQTQLRLGAALKDPLVINFDRPIPEFSQTTFEFDLLANGTKNTLQHFSSDSAYLSIDKNNNGKIDDGSELFGPATNSGFSELRAYDLDQNNWIDENDAVFSKLKLWSKNPDGSDSLIGLVDRSVGAIYLGNVATGLDLYAATNQVGRLRDSGIVLTESGKTLTIQEIDLKL
jgi:hypothetical protein